MDQSPPQTIVVPNLVKVIDRRGRSIEIRKMNTLDRMRMFEIVGSENSQNPMYLGLAGLAFCVANIDGNPVGRIGTKLALETLVKELDDDGFDAIAAGVEQNFLPPERTEVEIKAAIKNE